MNKDVKINIYWNDIIVILMLVIFLVMGIAFGAIVANAENNAHKVVRYTQHLQQNYVNRIGVAVQGNPNRTPELVYYDLPPLKGIPLVFNVLIDNDPNRPARVFVDWKTSLEKLPQLKVFER